MGDARSRLLLAIAASGALHLALIYGVRVRALPPPALPIVARLEPPGAPSPPADLAPRLSPRPSPAPNPVARGTPPAAPGTGGEQPSPALPDTPALAAPATDAPLPSVEMPLLVDPTWYRAQDLDIYPHALGPVVPAYPAQAQRDGIGGEVTLMLKVDDHGVVRDVAVAQAAPEGYFEAAAITALQTARFAPAERAGRSVRSQIVIRVLFDPRQVQ